MSDPMIYTLLSSLALLAGFAGLAYGWWLDRIERHWKRAIFCGSLTCTQGLDLDGGEAVLLSGFSRPEDNGWFVVIPSDRGRYDPVPLTSVDHLRP